MNIQLKIRKIGNHWYPNINHEIGDNIGFDEKTDRYLTRLDILNWEEYTIEFEELGIIFEGINIIYFNEQDIVRYLTTDDDFDLRFVINNHEFKINSDLYWLLEDQFNFNFHKTSYRIHIL